MTDFNKPAGRAASLVDQWIERGLDVPDRARAEQLPLGGQLLPPQRLYPPLSVR